MGLCGRFAVIASAGKRRCPEDRDAIAEATEQVYAG
jgi:hypothetical protein